MSVNDCVWYLRAANLEEKTKWVETLEQYKVRPCLLFIKSNTTINVKCICLQIESGYGSETSLQRYGSAHSISSNKSTLSSTSDSSFQKGRGLRVKLAELETYRDILVQQIDKLQKYFDASSGVGPPDNSMSSTGENLLNSSHLKGHAHDSDALKILSEVHKTISFHNDLGFIDFLYLFS